MSEKSEWRNEDTSTIQTIVRKLQNDFLIARNDIKKESTALMEAQEYLETTIKAQKLIQAAAESVQKIAHSRLTRVVSKSLNALFPGTYEFRILFESKRGGTTAKPVFIKDENTLDPVSASGGGVVDVAATTLRIGTLLLQSKSRRVLVLDEPFKHLSAEHTKSVKGLLETLSRDLDLQIIMITHNPGLAIGKVLEL